jgi:molybdate transport system substrate-binding protein
MDPLQVQEVAIGGIRIAVAAIGVVMSAATAGAAEVTVLSTPIRKSALDDLAPAFTRAAGHTLVLTFEGVPVLKRQIETGDVFDAAIPVAGNGE